MKSFGGTDEIRSPGVKCADFNQHRAYAIGRETLTHTSSKWLKTFEKAQYLALGTFTQYYTIEDKTVLYGFYLWLGIYKTTGKLR